MKIRLTSKGNIATKGFRISTEEIESQILSDLSKYRKIFFERYGVQAPILLDVESLVKELWGVEVSYEDIPQTEIEEVLGYYVPATKKIVVDPKICNNPKRVSFTVAHEAGHLSLHSFMFVNQKKNEKKLIFDISIERQADTYAANLLAPKHELLEFLREQNIWNGELIISPIDINLAMSVLQPRFGLSKHAMEIHFQRLGIPIVNMRYAQTSRKATNFGSFSGRLS